MDNLETVLDELEKFEKKAISGGTEIPEILEDYLRAVAKTGNTIFPWARIKQLVRYKLSAVMGEFYDLYGSEEIMEGPNLPPFSYAPTRDKILQHFDTFTGAPFTIQRICEILVDPMRHYKRTDKFLRGLEKNVRVVSFIDPIRLKRMSQQMQDHQQFSLVNGLESGSPHSPPASSSSSASASFIPQGRRSPVSHSNSSVTNGAAEYSEDAEAGDLCDDRGDQTVPINNTNEDCASASSSSSSSSSSPTTDEELEEEPHHKRLKLDMSEHVSEMSPSQRIDCESHMVDDDRADSGSEGDHEEEANEAEGQHSELHLSEENEAKRRCPELHTDDLISDETAHNVGAEDGMSSNSSCESSSNSIHKSLDSDEADADDGVQMETDAVVDVKPTGQVVGTSQEASEMGNVMASSRPEVGSSNNSETGDWNMERDVVPEDSASSEMVSQMDDDTESSPDSAQDSSLEEVNNSEQVEKECDSEAMAAWNEKEMRDEEICEADQGVPVTFAGDSSEADSTSSHGSSSHNISTTPSPVATCSSVPVAPSDILPNSAAVPTISEETDTTGVQSTQASASHQSSPTDSSVVLQTESATQSAEKVSLTIESSVSACSQSLETDFTGEAHTPFLADEGTPVQSTASSFSLSSSSTCKDWDECHTSECSDAMESQSSASRNIANDKDDGNESSHNSEEQSQELEVEPRSESCSSSDCVKETATDDNTKD